MDSVVTLELGEALEGVLEYAELGHSFRFTPAFVPTRLMTETDSGFPTTSSLAQLSRPGLCFTNLTPVPGRSTEPWAIVTSSMVAAISWIPRCPAPSSSGAPTRATNTPSSSTVTSTRSP